jgi:hypothetical protein
MLHVFLVEQSWKLDPARPSLRTAIPQRYYSRLDLEILTPTHLIKQPVLQQMVQMATGAIDAAGIPGSQLMEMPQPQASACPGGYHQAA